MRYDTKQMRAVPNAELRLVRGGKFWDRVKKAAKWVKNHVEIGWKYIRYKRTF
jgi:hypothetical protein